MSFVACPGFWSRFLHFVACPGFCLCPLLPVPVSAGFCTIADLADAPCIGLLHLGEAIQYRQLDRGQGEGAIPWPGCTPLTLLGSTEYGFALLCIVGNSMRITFELSDSDLKHFRGVMKHAMEAHKGTEPKAIISAAEGLLAEVKKVSAPGFIKSRLAKLRELIDMLNDEGWALPDTERARVVSALAYFSDPEDLIPDEIPGLGFLDDAIMIELVARELKPELEAYDDFCRYRSAEVKRRGLKAEELVREDYFVNRRKQLHARIKRRRRAGKKRRAGGRVGSNLNLFGR